MTLYATFSDCDSAEHAVQDLLSEGALSSDLRLLCWEGGSMVSVVVPSGDLDRDHSQEILQRYAPLTLGDEFEARVDCAATNLYEDDFRADSLARFSGPRWEGSQYNDFKPAYYYGSELAHDLRFKDCDWSELEEEARQNWTGQFQYDWENMKEAIQYGFERVHSGPPAAL